MQGLQVLAGIKGLLWNYCLPQRDMPFTGIRALVVAHDLCTAWPIQNSLELSYS